MKSTFAILLFAFVVQSIDLRAQVNPASFKLRDGTADLAVPESPAFTALGVTPQQVTRPGTGRELATSLLNGVDKEGNLQTGIAIDTAPYMLLAGPTIQLLEYQKRSQYLTRFLARWQTSFASTKGGSDSDKSAKLALGFRFSIFDLGDPRGDRILLTCLANNGGISGAPIGDPNLSADANALLAAAREPAIREASKKCRDDSVKRNWNRSAWIIGAAPTWTSPNGVADKLSYSGTALWTSLGFGFDNVPLLREHAMIAVYAKRP